MHVIWFVVNSCYECVSYINLPVYISTEDDSQITIAHVKSQVYLSSCEPQFIKPTMIPHIICEEDIYLVNKELIRQMFEKLPGMINYL